MPEVKIQKRIIEQVCVYKLYLRHLLEKDEKLPDLVAVAFEEQALLNYIQEHRVEKYIDGPFEKGFRQGSPLEMYSHELRSGAYGVFWEWISNTSLKEQLKNRPKIFIQEYPND